MEKRLSNGLLAIYLLLLTWVVIFKLRFNIGSILHYHHRSLNLVPFAAPSIVNGQINYSEMIFNFLLFMPFGLLLNVNFRKVHFWVKLACIIAFSFIVESIQFIFAIGASDITDLITNTAGGLVGLVLYELGNKYMGSQKLNRVINVVGMVLLVLLISIRANVILR